MKFNRAHAVLVMATAACTLAMTACGNSGTISSLTDSDSTASIAEGAAGDTASVMTGSISIAQTAESTTPEIAPQTVPATEITATPDAEVGGGTASTADDSEPAAGVTKTADTDASAGTESGEETAANTSADGEISLLSEADEAEEEPTPAPEEESFEPAGEGNIARITGDEVNLRETPTTEDGDDNVLLTMFEGDEVKILGSEDGWYKVSYDGEVGWVSSAYVE